jgi:hypothetical protein
VKIRFETTIDDFLAFVTFHHAQSPASRRQRRNTTWTLPAVLGVMMLVSYRYSDQRQGGNALTYLVFCGAVLILVTIAWYFLVVHWYFPWAVERNTRKLLAEGSNRLLLGWREMELVNGRLVLNSELIHSSLDLRAVEKIVSTERYTFVYLGSVSAYIIPMNLYPEDEYRQYVAELRAAWENRGITLPPIEEAPKRAQADERIVERPH